MTCHEAAIFVSALYDGDAIPPAAAQHLGTCATCKALLADFAEMGTELRRSASLQTPSDLPVPLWAKPQGTLTGWWQKGWQMMRIPRFAFALLLVGIVVLGSSLALVKVRAHDEGTVLNLQINTGTDHPRPCSLSTVDKNNGICQSIGPVEGKILTYAIKFLQKDGGRVQLGIRSTVGPTTASGSYSLSALNGLPEQQLWFEPGQTLHIPVAGLADLTVTGEWTDHMPSIMSQDQHMDPGPRELRISSPLLLQDHQVVGDLEGGIASVDKRDEGIQIFLPGAGKFQVSLDPVAGAVPADVKINRLAFQSNGKSFVFVTATPIARASKIWVLHDPNFKPEPGTAGGFIGSTAITPTPQEN